MTGWKCEGIEPIMDLRRLYGRKISEKYKCPTAEAEHKSRQLVDELLKSNYKRDRWKIEAKAFIAGIFPEELVEPTTKTSEYLAKIIPSVRIKKGRIELLDKPHAEMIKRVLVDGEDKVEVWFRGV
jgi:phosphoenolpyruvate carboxylase